MKLYPAFLGILIAINLNAQCAFENVQVEKISETSFRFSGTAPANCVIFEMMDCKFGDTIVPDGDGNFSETFTVDNPTHEECFKCNDLNFTLSCSDQDCDPAE